MPLPPICQVQSALLHGSSSTRVLPDAYFHGLSTTFVCSPRARRNAPKLKIEREKRTQFRQSRNAWSRAISIPGSRLW